LLSAGSLLVETFTGYLICIDFSLASFPGI
jgi:hypothetical protein